MLPATGERIGWRIPTVPVLQWAVPQRVEWDPEAVPLRCGLNLSNLAAAGRTRLWRWLGNECRSLRLAHFCKTFTSRSPKVSVTRSKVLKTIDFLVLTVGL